MIEESLICALLVGEAETEKLAKKIASSYKNCPYVNLMTTSGKELYAIFFLPVRQKWWIEYIEKKPQETFKLRKAKITFLDSVYYPEKLNLRIPQTLKEISPCGSNCDECPSSHKCICCPATIFYKKMNNSNKLISSKNEEN
ncbi:MAG: hypothetical protein ACFFBZ_10710 [Promethearchaeota archaeon]